MSQRPRLTRIWSFLPPALVLGGAAALAIAGQLLFASSGQLVALVAVYIVAGVIGAWAMLQRPIAPASPLPRWVEVVGLAVILLFALVVRTDRLAIAPEGIWFDEAEHGLVALRILADPTYRPVFVPAPVHLPALYFYWMAASIQAFGASIVALRLISVVVGLAMIVGVYAFGRLLFGAPVALVAAALLASQRWQLNFSRWAMTGILAPAAAVGVLFFLIRGFRRRQPADFAWAGICVGIGMYSYPPFTIMAPLIALTVAVYFLSQPRTFLRDYWRGLSLFVVTALVVLAPLLHFIVTQPQVYTERLGITSIFRDKPADQTQADLIENVRRHLLMLHVRGDTNGRHNIPGEPMLDPVSGALLVLGLAFVIAQRRRESVIVLAWFAISLMPGILSLEFEAPQAYRSLMLIPLVALLPALPLGWLITQAWAQARSPGRRALAPALAGLAVLVVVVIGAQNTTAYFQRQLTNHASWSAYSTAETLAARVIAAAPTDVRLYASQLFMGQPAMRWLVPKTREHTAYDAPQHLPLRDPRPTTLVLSPEVDRQMDQIRRYYPGATWTEHTGPGDGPSIMTRIDVRADDIAALQGVTASYYPGPTAPAAGEPSVRRKETSLAVNWEGGAPLPTPFAAVWRATLAAPQYGKYRLRADGPPATRLLLDGTEIISGGQDGVEVTLAQGNHALELHATVRELTPLTVAWQLPGLRAWQPLPREHLFVAPVQATGLVGSYFPNKTWTGTPALQRVDPTVAFKYHNTPLPRPWSAEWSGAIAIPTPGSYRFGLQTLDPAQLYIDDKLVVENTTPNNLAERPVALTAGLHAFRIRYQDLQAHSHIAVYWQPPDAERTVIPSDRLLPATVLSTRTITLPSAPPPSARPTQPVQPLATTLVPRTSLAGAQPPDPRGVAVDAGGNVYVVDTANRQLRKFDPAGQPLWVVGPGSGESALEEPVAVATVGADQVAVLDSKTGWVHRFDAAGKPVGRTGGPPARLYQPRGFAIDAAGDIYVADTGGARVAVLGEGGAVAAQVGVSGDKPGQTREPVDVAVDRQGTVFIADAGNKTVLAIAADGSLRGEWAIPAGGSVIAPHLTPEGSGGVYMTDPDGGTIRQYSATGDLLAEIGPLDVDGTPLRRPMGIALVAPDVLVVTDLDGRRVVKITLR